MMNEWNCEFNTFNMMTEWNGEFNTFNMMNEWNGEFNTFNICKIRSRIVHRTNQTILYF